jgi:hypothetical protein
MIEGSSSGNGSAAIGAAVKKRSIRSATAGPKIASPAATARTARPSSSCSALDHVSAGPRTHRDEHRFVVVEHRQHQHRHLWHGPPIPRVAPNPSAQPNRDGVFSEE